MKEYKLLIRNLPGSKEAFSKERHLEFVQACERYIGGLKAAGKLLGAQPLEREGLMLAGKEGAWTQSPFQEGKDVIVGDYHVLADDLEEAVTIAKGNPEFSYTDTARVEVRPIKGSERSTGFVYPKAS